MGGPARTEPHNARVHLQALVARAAVADDHGHFVLGPLVHTALAALLLLLLLCRHRGDGGHLRRHSSVSLSLHNGEGMPPVARCVEQQTRQGEDALTRAQNTAQAQRTMVCPKRFALNSNRPTPHTPCVLQAHACPVSPLRRRPHVASPPPRCLTLPSLLAPLSPPPRSSKKSRARCVCPIVLFCGSLISAPAPFQEEIKHAAIHKLHELHKEAVVHSFHETVRSVISPSPARRARFFTSRRRVLAVWRPPGALSRMKRMPFSLCGHDLIARGGEGVDGGCSCTLLCVTAVAVRLIAQEKAGHIAAW